MSTPDFSTMSDEELMSYVPEEPPSEQAEALNEEPVQEETQEVQEVSEEPEKVLPSSLEERLGGDPEDEDETSDEDEKPSSTEEQEEEKADEPKSEEPSPEKEEAPSTESKETAEVPTEPDYADFHKKITAPFKANGQSMQVRDADEAIRLMQMGANYTQKMQALAPNMKLMRMLQNNNLLNEEKLSFLIDLDQKNPQAIQKLLHEGKIDPLDVDPSAAPAYKPSNKHQVSDKEMAFHTVFEEVTSSDVGKATVRHIEQTWDKASKDTIFEEPQVLAIINTQRENGIYDTIRSEILRRQALGQLSHTVPFLQAYKEVGDQLHKQGALAPKNEPAPAAVDQAPQQQTIVPPAPERPAVERRPATRRQPTDNGDKARAASAAPRVAQTPAKRFDPFSMTDAEIMAMSSPPV